MMTDKDCNDFATLVQKMQDNNKKTPVKRPNTKDQQIMALYAKIKDLNEISEAHQKLNVNPIIFFMRLQNGKLNLKISELEKYVRTIKSTTQRTSRKTTRKS